MLDESRERKLAAILFADAVGFSSLMGVDEEGTVERFTADFHDIIEPRVGGHKGEIIKKTGDGFLAIFPSVMEAMACAEEMQSEFHDESAVLGVPISLTYRIGINLGDILVEEGDVYGDAVNVAHRLQELAHPGGIAVSGAAYWNVKRKSELRFERMGFLNLKHIVNPIEVYRVAGPAVETSLPSDITHLAEDTNHARPPETPSAIPKIWSEGQYHHPTIVILPFENQSRDVEQDYFCDGLTSDLTAELSRFANLVVIASYSAFSYRGQRPSPEQLTRELGVDYMVEGSVQRIGDIIRVNAQLMETSSKRHLWSKKVKRSLDKLFEFQDEVVREIVASLASKLSTVERERGARIEIGSGNAYDMFLRGLYFINRFLGNDESKDTLDCAQRYFAQTIELDDSYARAWGWQAYILVQKWLYGWEEEAVLKTAEGMATMAVKLDPDDHDTHWALASVLSNSGQFEQATVEYEKALEINSNDADLHAEMSELLTYMGKPHEAIGQVKFAMHLNPHFPDWYCSILGWAYYFAEEYDEAIAELGRMVSPSDEEFLIVAVCHARRAEALHGDGQRAQGEEEDRAARDAITRFLQKRPQWTIEKQHGLARFLKNEDLQHWLVGLRLAGLPEA